MFVPVPVQLARPIISVSTCYAHISRCVWHFCCYQNKVSSSISFFFYVQGRVLLCCLRALFHISSHKSTTTFFWLLFLFKLKIQIQIELLIGQSISIFQEHVYPNTLSLHVNIYHAVGDGFVNQKKKFKP